MGVLCHSPDRVSSIEHRAVENNDLALEHGRAYVDRRMDKPELATPNLPVQKLRR